MMRRFKFMILALVAMCGFTACEKDCDHDFIEVDYNKSLVGTWTLVNEGFAEAWVVKEDGSVEVTGVLDGEYYETKGTVKLKNNKIHYKFDDGSEFEGLLDIIPGKCFSMIDAWNYESDYRMVYQYCKNDLADEIVGMWVCNEGLPGVKNDMAIVTYSGNGKMTMTTQASAFIPSDVVNGECDYKVVGDLMFIFRPGATLASRLVYTPNGTTLGDIYTQTLYAPTEHGTVELTSSFLRIKQNLDLANNSYDYINIYVSNVKGEDKEFDIMGYTLNFATMDGSKLDKMLKSTLFQVGFPNANTIKYSYQFGEQKNEVTIPIEVEGNKLTLKMSNLGAALKDITFYAFQDADNTQMHLYMHRNTVVDFYTNMQALLDTWANDKDVINDAEAVKAIYNSFDKAIESINMSIILKSDK